MIKVTIYGRLRKFIGESSFEINADSPKKAFSFLINNFKGVKEHIKDQEYCIMAGDLRVTEELLDMHTESDIKIIPVVHGEILPILFGIGALAAQSALTTAFTATVFGGIISTGLTIIGTNLLITGITDLLTPDPVNPNARRQEDPQDTNYAFTGLLNNTKQGVPINIVYGEVLVGSTVVSATVDSVQATYTLPQG